MIEEELELLEESESEGVGENPAPEEARSPEPERTFTQEQVNAIAGKAREEGRRRGYEDAKAEMVSRYGLDGEGELDDIYGKGSRYDELNERYGSQGSELREARAELALVKAGISPERYGDVRAILAAKGMDVCEEAIAAEIGTHPEWSAAPEQAHGGCAANAAPSVEPVGAIPSPAAAETEEERSRKEAERLFGLRLGK